MEIGQRIKHNEFGLGTVKYIMFEDTRREMYLVEFDNSNCKFHDGFSYCKQGHGYWCKKGEVEKADEQERV